MPVCQHPVELPRDVPASFSYVVLGETIQRGYLNQNTFDEHDRATDLKRHYSMMQFLVHLLDIFPREDKTAMRRRQEDLLFDIVQVNYSADYDAGYQKIIEKIEGGGK